MVRWISALGLLLAVGAWAFLGGKMTEDPYVDVPVSAAGPLPWWMVPSIYAVIGLFWRRSRSVS